MASHVGLQGVATGMRQALPIATPPLTSVLLLSILNMRVVDMLNQFVHISLVSGWTAIPVANRDLILKIFLIESRINRRAGNIARRV